MPAKKRGRPSSAAIAKARKRLVQAASSALRRKIRVRRPLALKQHNFVERCTPFLMTVGQESTATGLFRSFTLDDCLQVAHYKELFEYYRIDKVVIEFRYKGAATPAYTTINGTGTQANEINNEINPVLYFKVDHNDASAQTLNDLKESMRTKEHQLTNGKPNFTIQIKPAILAEAYKTALASAYRPKWKQWISMDDSNVPHYGLKVYAVAGLANNPNMGQIEVQQKIYFSAKCNE